MPADCLLPAIEAFYQLGVPVDVQIVEEVFAGAWDALQSRRVDMIVGADQLSKPAGSFATKALGEVPFVFAVAANHPLANAKEPLAEADIAPYPAAVAADTSRSLPPGHAGIFRRQRTLTVSNIDQKIAVQEAGGCQGSARTKAGHCHPPGSAQRRQGQGPDVVLGLPGQ